MSAKTHLDECQIIAIISANSRLSLINSCMANPELGGFEPSREDNNGERQKHLEETLNAYPEIRDLLEQYSEDDAIRNKVVDYISSNDPTDGTTERKINKVASGQFTGDYNPQFLRWQKTQSYEDLVDRLRPPVQQNEDDVFRFNQAEYLLGQAKARLEMISNNPLAAKNPLEDSQLRNEIERYQAIIDNKGMVKPYKPATQTKTQSS